MDTRKIFHQLGIVHRNMLKWWSCY